MLPIPARQCRRVLRLLTHAGIATALIAQSSGVLAATDISGVWLNDTGNGAVHLRYCGAHNESLCGYVVWLSSQIDRAGKPIKDSLNPDPKLRGKPICGLQVIGRLKPQRDGSWDNGWIYDPEMGKSFDVAVKQLSVNRLKITGYMGTKLLSKSFVWRRAPSNINHCTSRRS